MKREEILAALEAGEFDGIDYTYAPYSGYGNNSHHKEMSVSSGTIEITTITTGKYFDGKENKKFQEEGSTEVLSGYGAVEYIESHPYNFAQKRPDLF